MNNFKNLRKFARSVFEKERPDDLFLFPVKLHAGFFPLPVNGFVQTIGFRKHRCANIVINYFPFLRDRKQRSSGLTRFFLYATIVHELEHLQLENRNDFWSFMAGFYQQRNRSVGWVKFPLSGKKAPMLLPELLCTRAGLHRAFEALGNDLDEHDRDTVTQMLRSVDFLCEHLEIVYGRSSQPYSLFAQNMGLLSKHRCREKLLPQLALLLDDRQQLFSPAKWYHKRTEETNAFYDDLLIQTFLFLKMDWDKLFLDTAFFDHMEVLANGYLQRCIDYLKHMHQGELFVSNEVLTDNAAMLIKNANRLNQLMRRFGMKRTCGAVIPMF